MDKKLISLLAKKLEEKRAKIETELKSFAKEDKNLKGDWDTRFPNQGNESGGSALEQAADEVEEYGNLLPVEHSLELRLRDIDLALKKIKRGNYGKCEKCKKEIAKERLEVHPEARTCSQCK